MIFWSPQEGSFFVCTWRQGAVLLVVRPKFRGRYMSHISWAFSKFARMGLGNEKAELHDMHLINLLHFQCLTTNSTAPANIH